VSTFGSGYNGSLLQGVPVDARKAPACSGLTCVLLVAPHLGICATRPPYVGPRVDAGHLSKHAVLMSARSLAAKTL
jgi:hypothetical protein